MPVQINHNKEEAKERILYAVLSEVRKAKKGKAGTVLRQNLTILSDEK